MRLASTISIIVVLACASVAQAADIKYKRAIKIKVGESVVLKGARNEDCGDTAPDWKRVTQELPKTDLGTFSDGGVGTIKSNRCGGRVGARAIIFTATKAGRANLNVAGDPVKVTIR